jgi:hypothetical protein
MDNEVAEVGSGDGEVGMLQKSNKAQGLFQFENVSFKMMTLRHRVCMNGCWVKHMFENMMVDLRVPTS